MRALEMAWPFVPEVHLFHSREKCRRFIRDKLGFEPKFSDNSASTWYREDVAVVMMNCDASWHAEAALLCHEAVHVASMHFAHMGEEHPNEEFSAYLVQVVSRALFEAHEKWKRKHVEAE